MPNVFNLFSIKINSVSSNGSVNFGNNIFKGNSADLKRVGGSLVIGDASPSVNIDKNVFTDPDVVDQGNAVV